MKNLEIYGDNWSSLSWDIKPIPIKFKFILKSKNRVKFLKISYEIFMNILLDVGKRNI